MRLRHPPLKLGSGKYCKRFASHPIVSLKVLWGASRAPRYLEFMGLLVAGGNRDELRDESRAELEELRYVLCCRPHERDALDGIVPKSAAFISSSAIRRGFRAPVPSFVLASAAYLPAAWRPEKARPLLDRRVHREPAALP